MERIRKLAAFALVSGTGLALDFAVFAILLRGGMTIYPANLTSAACAVTFVYFASVQRVFSYRGQFLFGLFAAYVAYQIAGITLASMAVAALAQTGLSALLAKFTILPVTFGANFLFMMMLTRQGRRANQGAEA